MNDEFSLWQRFVQAFEEEEVSNPEFLADTAKQVVDDFIDNVDTSEEIKVGDRVKVINTKGDLVIKFGDNGEVIRSEKAGILGVYFENEIDGHTCSGLVEDCNAWWVNIDQVEKI